MELDIQEIMQTLPHRYPFLMVDRIVDVVPGKSAVGIKNVSINEPFFTGHWPGEPVMPGVLIIEAMAQVGGIILLKSDEDRGKRAFFGAVDSVRFKRPVVPGDQIRIEVELTKRRGNIGKVRTVATVDGEVVCSGELTFALIPREGAAQPSDGEQGAAQ
jgi:3-hydroxyacyl-[acyl-carrier-protein] dehydratase